MERRNRTGYLRAMATVASKTRTALNVERIYPVNKGLARVVISSASPLVEADIREAFSAMYDNKVALVEGSAQDVSVPHRHMVSAFVSVNRTAKAYSEDAVKNMKVVTANVFADDENGIWKLVGEGENRLIVQTSDDDLEQILRARQSRQITTAGFEPGMAPAFADYVFYMDPESLEVRSGFAVTESQVFDRAAERVVDVTPLLVMECVSGMEVKDGQPVEESNVVGAPVVAFLNQGGASKHLDYMRKLYKNTPYFVKLEQLIRQRMGLGDGGGFTSTQK